MKIGGLIVAAGMSSRMGAFKPMLPLGNTTIIRQVISTLQTAGASPITVITGKNAEELKAHVEPLGVTCIFNQNYEKTHMFDSVCIGLNYLQDLCDFILFTPGDSPLFQLETVQLLLDSGAEVAIPIRGTRHGHPVFMSTKLIPKIMAFTGEGGLRGALENCGTEIKYIEVHDNGSFLDADTPADYAKLQALLKE